MSYGIIIKSQANVLPDGRIDLQSKSFSNNVSPKPRGNMAGEPWHTMVTLEPQGPEAAALGLEDFSRFYDGGMLRDRYARTSGVEAYRRWVKRINRVASMGLRAGRSYKVCYDLRAALSSRVGRPAVAEGSFLSLELARELCQAKTFVRLRLDDEVAGKGPNFLAFVKDDNIYYAHRRAAYKGWRCHPMYSVLVDETVTSIEPWPLLFLETDQFDAMTGERDGSKFTIRVREDGFADEYVNGYLRPAPIAEFRDGGAKLHLFDRAMADELVSRLTILHPTGSWDVVPLTEAAI